MGRILERSVRGPGNWGRHSPTRCPAAAEAAVPGAPGASWPPCRLPWRSVAGAMGSTDSPPRCSALKAGGQRWPSLPEASCLESGEEAHSAAARPLTGRRDQGRNESSSRLPGPRGSASRDRPPKACFQPQRVPWGQEGCWRRTQVLWPGSPRLAMPMSLLLGKAHGALTPASAQGQEMPNWEEGQTGFQCGDKCREADGSLAKAPPPSCPPGSMPPPPGCPPGSILQGLSS